MTGKKGYINGVYIVQVDGFPKMRYFFYGAREAEREYRKQFALKYRRIEWRRAIY